jgi:ABC-type multidrug transport system permease subunit
MFENIKTNKDGGVYVAAAYAAMFIVSLALAIAGGVMLLIGLNVMQIIWIYAATLLAFSCCIAIDLAYTFHKRKVAMVEVEVPPIAVEEEAKAKHVRAS